LSRRSTYVVLLVVVAVVGGVAGTLLALTTGDRDSGTAADAGATSDAPARHGLRWVFPSMAGQDCDEDTSPDPAGGRRERWVCRDSFAGYGATVYYSRWSTLADAGVYSDSWKDGTFRRQPGATDRAGSGFDRWAGTNEGSYKLTWAYQDAPYSVTVVLPLAERPTFDDVLLDGLVELRPAAEVTAR
jgi:hypothetical protein